MKLKLLALLKTKFDGVDDAILTRIADKKAEGVTDESQLQSIADGVSFSDVLTSYGDFRANGAVVSAVANYEKKHNLKDGKPIKTPDPTPDPNQVQTQNPNDIAAIVANAVQAAVKPFSDKIEQFETEKKAVSRHQQVMEKAKEYGIPESQAKRYLIPDDADLDTYFKEAKQELTNLGFKGVQVPETAEAKIQKNNEEVFEMIDKGTKEINDNNKK